MSNATKELRCQIDEGLFDKILEQEAQEGRKRSWIVERALELFFQAFENEKEPESE